MKLQHEGEATELCRESFSGSIAPSDAGSSFSSMPTSALPQLAGQAVDTWRGRRQQTLPRAFVQKFTQIGTGFFNEPQLESTRLGSSREHQAVVHRGEPRGVGGNAKIIRRAEDLQKEA